MKVLVVGSGGREHALVWKLTQSPLVDRIYCAPGNAGTAPLAVNLSTDAGDLTALAAFARAEKVDLTVIGPEAPLVAGIVDHFQQAGLRVAGPSKAAAALEGSKSFAKEFMRRHAIPTAEYRVHDDPAAAEKDLKAGVFRFPMVVKADGLAAGKGVFICRNLEESLEALDATMGSRRFGSAGDRIVLEEFLEGEEASFLVFTDGETILPMVASQDHKAIYEGDQGPNTGGMGAYSTDSILTEELRQEVLDRIIAPTIRGMAEEGARYAGILYAGLMIGPAGPKVLEFNVRFGDPETQVVLPRLDGDLFEVLDAVAGGRLDQVRIAWRSDAAVCVVLAAGGYPGPYQTGREVSGLEMAGEDANTVVFHAGTRLEAGRVVTNGGRVLGVTATAPTLSGAVIRAYEAVNKIYFEGMYCRRDIASKGLRRLGQP